MLYVEGPSAFENLNKQLLCHGHSSEKVRDFAGLSNFLALACLFINHNLFKNWTSHTVRLDHATPHFLPMKKGIGRFRKVNANELV